MDAQKYEGWFEPTCQKIYDEHGPSGIGLDNGNRQLIYSQS